MLVATASMNKAVKKHDSKATYTTCYSLCEAAFAVCLLGDAAGG